VMSGDKLLGGPQAGLIVGDARWIEAMRRNPLARSYRVDKLTLAALEATLALYREPARALTEIPTLALLGTSADELKSFSETAGAARRLVKKFYLYFNNHFASKAVVNAVMIKEQLGEPVTGTYPKEFVERYPETASIVSTGASPQLSPLLFE